MVECYFWACGCLDVAVRGLGGSHSMFHCEELGEEGWEKGRALSHIRPTCNLIEK